MVAVLVDSTPVAPARRPTARPVRRAGAGRTAGGPGGTAARFGGTEGAAARSGGTEGTAVRSGGTGNAAVDAAGVIRAARARTERSRAARAQARHRRVLVGGAALFLAGLWLALQATASGAGGVPLTSTGAAGGTPAAARVWVVRPGDTLWSIARAAEGTGDIRPLVDRLAAETGGRPLQAGERIPLP